ncbi:hypothetical protein [Deinococcus sp. UYEF24]
MLTLFTVCALLGGTLLILALLESSAAWSRRAEWHGDAPQTPRFTTPHSTEVRSFLGTGRARSVLLGLASFATFFGLGGSLASWLGLHPTFQWVFALLSGLAVGGFTAFALSLAQESLAQESLNQVRGELFQSAPDSQSLSLVERTAEALSPTGGRTEQVHSGLK